MKRFSLKKSLLIAAAFGVASLLFLGVFIYIIFGKITAVKGSQSKGVIYSQNVENVLRIKKEANKLTAETQTLDSFFIRPGEEAGFLEKVERLGKSLGLKVAIDSVTEGENALNIFLKYEGPLQTNISFLKKLEGLPQAVSLSGVNMNLVEGNKAIWTGSLKLSVYKIK